MATASVTGDITATARGALLLALLVVVPLFVDLRTLESYNLPKFTVTLIGALTLGALWLVEAVRPGSGPVWRNGLHWPVLALVGWTAVSTATSVSPRMSILGAMGTNDGLLAAAAFAVFFFASAQAVDLDRVKAMLTVLYLGAGGLTVLYGLIQLHDRIFPGTRWDWLRHFQGEGTESFALGGIFSTFGNPNHLAGFLAVLAPVGLAVLMLHKSRRLRVLTLVIMLSLVVELFQSASRGALLAALVALGLASALLWPDMRRRPRISLSVVGAVVASVVVAALAVVAVPQSSAKFSTILNPSSTLSVRVAIWEAGLAMGNGRPLVGHGPDTWVDRVSKFRDAENIERYGPGVFSSSAHNLFIGQLAATGYPGLILLLAVLGFAALRAVGAWRRLRQIETAGRDDEASRARHGRLLLAGVVGGLVAFLVQACFNVSQTGLSFVFWVLLGLLCALSLAVGVPVGLPGRALVSHAAAPALLGDADSESGSIRQPRKGDIAEGGDIASAAIAVVVCAGLVFAISIVSRPYRADHNAWAARVDSATAAQSPPDVAGRLSRQAAIRARTAIDLNPWEPTYLTTMADAFWKEVFSHPDRSPSQIAALHNARDQYERAIALRPNTVPYLKRYADVLLKLHEVDPTASDARDEAVQALRRAVNADPASGDARERLQLLVAE